MEAKYIKMTTQPVEKLVLQMAGPAIGSMLMSSIYNMADTYFVGKIGTSATAAVGVVFPIMAVIQAFGFFFGHGSGNFMSRALGQKKEEEAKRMAITGTVLSLIMGVLLTVLGLIFVEPLLYLLGSTETIYPYAKEYMTIILIGAPWMATSFVLNNQLRFQGNAFYAMIGLMTGGLLNIALDPLLIFAFKMGIAGAAWATILSQLISFCLLYLAILKSDSIKLKLRYFTPNAYYLKNICIGGVPSLCRQGLNSVATVCLNFACRGYGDAAIAAMSVVGRIMMFSTSILLGFGQGFQPVCGFNYGAGKYTRVRKATIFCMTSGFCFLFVMAILASIASPHLIALFRDDPAVIEIGAVALRYQCFVYPLNAVIIIGNMLFQTTGMMFRASFMAVARQGLFFIPVVLILPLMLELQGIMMAQPVADVLAFLFAVPMILSFLKVLKKDKSEEIGK